MSRSLEELKKLQENRMNKFTIALNKQNGYIPLFRPKPTDAPTPAASQPTPEPATQLEKKAAAKGQQKKKEYQEPKIAPTLKRTNHSTLIIASIGVLFMLNLALLALLFGSSSKNNNNLKKLNSIEGMLDTNSKQMSIIVANVKQLDDSIKEMNAKINEIKSTVAEAAKGADSQAFAIEKLEKAKNALYNRLNSLESKIDSLKPAPATTSSN